MYSLLVSGQAADSYEGRFSLPRTRFLEHTNSNIYEILNSLSNQAIECIQSWPCLLMTEGRSDEHCYVCRIESIDNGSEITLRLTQTTGVNPLVNHTVWALRDELHIDEWEFNRNHFAFKDRDLISTLHVNQITTGPRSLCDFPSQPLPVTPRRLLIAAKNSLSTSSHTEIDDFLAEAGVSGLSAEQQHGLNRQARAINIFKFAAEHPGAVTAENDLFSRFFVSRTNAVDQNLQPAFPSRGTTAASDPDEADPDDEGSVSRVPNRVFVVHGRDEGARTTVVNYLKELALDPVVLHEQPNMGQHVLTKFIREADLVTYAVVLLTGDDIGGLDADSLAPRARQNVILELGFFISHLGPDKVCALKQPGVEAPSDFDGVVYIDISDEDRWRSNLRRELVAAKLPVIDR
ncbi:MAG: nucleotide-binding protein [Planctomycetota bacterium]